MSDLKACRRGRNWLNWRMVTTLLDRPGGDTILSYDPAWPEEDTEDSEAAAEEEDRTRRRSRTIKHFESDF